MATPRRAVAMGFIAALAAVGMTAAPALAAKPAGNWEAIVGHHFRTKGEASAEAAQAQHKGFQTVIQTIHRNDVEVEIANGLPDKRAAEGVCAKADARGLHCSAEQELHGVTKHFGG
jgi:hypothetical protein